ncbi:MAG TPA: FlgD immunoglobulin-like domain containing protein [Candidatus Eisenbacteria bacterium]
MRPASSIRTAAAIALAASLWGAPAAAGPFSRLQVLLPGETAAPGSSTGKSGSAKSQVANIPFTITVRACDSQWNLVNTVTDVIEVLASDESATLPSAVQLQAGTRTYTVTLNSAGNFTLYAHDQSDITIPDGASASVKTQVLLGFRFSHVDPHDQRAGVAFPMTITAVDPSLSTVSGFNGVVSLKEITNFGEAATSPATVTMSSGKWSGDVTCYRKDETVDRGAVLYAWLPGLPGKDGTSEFFNVRANSFKRLLVILPGQTPAPVTETGLTGSPSSQISSVPFQVTIFSTDNWWNQTGSDHRVRLTTTDPAGVTPSSSTLSSGRVTVNVTLYTVGTQTLTATDRDNSSTIGMTTAGIPVIPNAAHHFAIATIASPQIAGQPVAVTIRAVDASNNTVPGYNADAVLYANTGLGSISPELISFANGVWSGNMIFRGAGANVQFTCSDFATTPHTGASNRFEVRAAALYAMQILLPGETVQPGTADGKTGSPSTQRAGTPFTATVRAVDQFWNLVNTASDTVALGSSDAYAGMPAETTLTSGQVLVPVRLALSGAQRLWVSDKDQPAVRPDTSAEVTILGGAFAKVLILAPGETVAPGTANGRGGAATDQSINYAFTCTVLACDPWWNPVSGVIDRVHVSSGDPLAQIGPDAPMVDGRAEFSVRLATGGWQQITVADLSDPSKAGSTTQVRAISSGLHLEASVSPSAARAGEPFTLTVRAVNDAGSVIQEVNSRVSLTVQHASTGQPGRGELVPTELQLLQGQRTISETYSFVEPIVLVARDDAGNAPAVSNVIAITPGQPTAIQFTCDPSWLHGNKHGALSAVVMDDFRNGVPDQPVSFTLVSGTGTLTPIDNASDANGVARADLLSPRQPEKEVLRASTGGVSADLEVAVSFVDPDAPGGTVTNYPNPCHPPLQGTTLSYKLDDNASVTIRIYSQSGALVREVFMDRGAVGGRTGQNEWVWDGRNGSGDVVASGGYVVLVEAQGTGQTLHVMRRKVAVVR